MRLIDAEELMMAMLRFTIIDGKIPLTVVIDTILKAPTVPLPNPPEDESHGAT